MGRKHVESGMQAFFGQILVRSTALFGEDDPCGLNWQLPMLCNEYNKMLLFKDKNEATQRVPVDNIMSNVFIQSGLYVVVYVGHAFFASSFLRITRNEAAACMRKCDIIHASSEQINFLVTRNLTNPRSAVSFIDSLDELSRFYWRLKVDPVDRSYMVFPVEHKPKATIESRNQILFDLASNLSHRATNLMPNNPVYGATCNRGEFTLYEGRMEEGSHSTVCRTFYSLLYLTCMSRRVWWFTSLRLGTCTISTTWSKSSACSISSRTSSTPRRCSTVSWRSTWSTAHFQTGAHFRRSHLRRRSAKVCPFPFHPRKSLADCSDKSSGGRC
jgi:hypothetical protein